MGIGRTQGQVVSAENMVLMKIVSEHAQDLKDAHGLVRRRQKAIDLEYLQPRVVELARLLKRWKNFHRFKGWLGDEQAGGNSQHSQ